MRRARLPGQPLALRPARGPAGRRDRALPPVARREQKPGAERISFVGDTPGTERYERKFKQMTSIFRSVLAALVLVLALSAIASASALASPEWYENGVAVKESKPVTSEGTLTLEGPFGYMAKERLKCSFSSKGTVSPAGKGSVTEEKLTNCKREATSGNEIVKCQEGQPLTATAVHLPWTTQLASSSENQNQTPGAVGWKWGCRTFFEEFEGFKVETVFSNECVGGLTGAIANEIGGVGESYKGALTQASPLVCTARETERPNKEGDAWPYSKNLIKAAGVTLSVK
jgi:hypothetical protein